VIMSCLFLPLDLPYISFLSILTDFERVPCPGKPSAADRGGKTVIYILVDDQQEFTEVL